MIFLKIRFKLKYYKKAEQIYVFAQKVTGQRRRIPYCLKKTIILKNEYWSKVRWACKHLNLELVEGHEI